MLEFNHTHTFKYAHTHAHRFIQQHAYIYHKHVFECMHAFLLHFLIIMRSNQGEQKMQRVQTLLQNNFSKLITLVYIEIRIYYPHLLNFLLLLLLFIQKFKI